MLLDKTRIKGIQLQYSHILYEIDCYELIFVRDDGYPDNNATILLFIAPLLINIFKIIIYL